jgi:hypothetical protein
LLGIEVVIEPLNGLHDAKLTWYVGLDAEATRIGDGLWNGEGLNERAASRVLALFRLSFVDEGLVANDLEGEPIYLILAMTADQKLRMKPQNLLTGLPIKHLETVI